MDLLKPIKSVVSKVKDVIDKKKDEDDAERTLSKWKQKLEKAKNQMNFDLMDEREAIYLGTKEVDDNINSDKKATKKANNVYNVTFEMIESEANAQIPQCAVKSKREGFQDLARMIEDTINNDMKEIGIEAINDVNERITPIQGYSIMTVDWDPDFKHHLYQGEIKVSSKHPKQLIPQPKVSHIQKMDYFFILSSVTKEYIERRYGVEVGDKEEEQYQEINATLIDGQPKSNDDNENVTEIVCWYKDKDGDVCKFVWINDTVLEDLPKYFYRRLERCTTCGEIKPHDGDMCEVCGSKRFKTKIEEEEELQQDIMLMDGTILPQGTKVPYFVPTRYPVSVRINVPKNFSFGGQSDVDIMRDQQDSIKKIGTKMEEKVMKSGTIVGLPDDLNVQITNETYQIIKMTPQQMAAFGVKELSAPIEKDMEFIEQQRSIIQRMLGVTNSFQGLEDNTAKSGVAKQIQVQQASGRMNSKMANKYLAFKELFEIMFEFRLAFCDELRPYLTKDDQGNDAYGEFDKYKFLCVDDSGQVYYNTDFLFSADAGSGLPKDPMFVFQQAQQMFQSQAINQLQYWSILESLNFPQAKQIKKQIEEEIKKQEELAELQAQTPQPNGEERFAQLLQGLTPEEQQAFVNASPEQQQAVMQAMMGGGTV